MWPIWGTFVMTPRVAKDAAALRIETRVRNETGAAAVCTLATAVIDRDGKVVQSVEASQEIAANGEYKFVQEEQVDQPNLWSVSEPYLYKLRSTVRAGDRVVDEYETPFGIREALFEADRGFLLNGEHVKLNGVCLHHDAGSVGAAVPERVWERRFEILRDMGVQRHPHQPQSARARVPGPVRPHGLPGDGRGVRRMEGRQAAGPRQRLLAHITTNGMSAT